MTSHVLRAAGSRSNTHWMSSLIAWNIFPPTYCVLIKIYYFQAKWSTFVHRQASVRTGVGRSGGSLQTHMRLSQGENAAQDVDLFLLQAAAGKEAPKPLHHSGGVTFW